MDEYLHLRFVVQLQYYFSLPFAAASVQQDPNDASKFVIVPQASTPNIQTVQVQQAANPVVSTISPSNQVNPSFFDLWCNHTRCVQYRDRDRDPNQNNDGQ